MRNIGVFIVTTMLVLSDIAFANDITLDEAINMAKENNSSIISLTAEKRTQESDYNKVVSNTRKWQNKSSYSFADADEYLLFSGNKLEEAQLKYNVYLKSLENAEESAEYNLISMAYNLPLTHQKIELLEKNVNLLEKQKLVYELKYKLNRITKLELDNFLLSLEQAKNTLENSKAQYDLAKENLKIVLGVTEEINIILPEIENKELVIEDMDSYILTNIENNKSFKELQYNYKVLEDNYITMKKGYGSELLTNISFQVKVLKDNYDAMGLQLQIIKNNLKMAFRSLYNTIKTSELELKSGKENLEIARINMDVVQERYEAGCVAELDYQAAKLKLEQAEIDYKSKIINNMLLNEEFEGFTKTGFTK